MLRIPYYLYVKMQVPKEVGSIELLWKVITCLNLRQVRTVTFARAQITKLGAANF